MAEEQTEQGQVVRRISTSKCISSIHEIYLVGEILPPIHYVEVFDQIRHAGDNDLVKIYLNTHGGDAQTAIQFLRVLSETKATTMASVEGYCMSAGTIIFLNCDMFEITDHSRFMFHNYSGGTIGKGGEMYDQVTHERKWSEKFLRDIYKDFLTDDEITGLLDNKDMWMDSDEVMTRMESKVKKYEEAAAQELAEEAVQAEVSKPKSRRKKTEASSEE